jgi:hypothetical protein
MVSDLHIDLCALNSCSNGASYYMGWGEGQGVWHGMVCATHDKQFGRQNIAKWKPWMSRQTIADWDNKFCKHPELKTLQKYVFSVDPEDCLE